jgi:hypothetical protein
MSLSEKWFYWSGWVRRRSYFAWPTDGAGGAGKTSFACFNSGSIIAWSVAKWDLCDAPGFHPSLLTLMNRSTALTLVKRRSTWAITSKTSPTNPNDPFWSTVVNLWSKPYPKLLNPFWPSVSRYFCRVLQISPKHFKISQCKSCVFCRGTQLSCWVAFEIRSLKGWKTQVKASGYYSPAHRKLPTWHAICAKMVEKKTLHPL